ncbi:MAG: VWA domain-containing protein [Polyangiaceae bacterium]|nr:VWA domain-containing protein [Polyangiaceae bacterium]
MSSQGAGGPADMKRRQILYWRLLTTTFGLGDKFPSFDKLSGEIVKELGMPEIVLDPSISIDTLLQRYPALKADFEAPLPIQRMPEDDDDFDADGDEENNAAGAAQNKAAEAAEASDATANEAQMRNPGGAEPTETRAIPAPEPPDLRKAVVLSKLLLNAFGPNTQPKIVTAGAYSQWTQDLAWLERSFGYAPGALRGRAKGGGAGASTQSGGGGGRAISEEELRAGFSLMEGDLIKRMALREILKDRQLADKITPSMPLIEQLLRDKANLSGEALANAKRLIRAYVDQLAEVLKLKVEKAARGKIDRSVPPKRIFRNLDLKRTIWKNLTNFNPETKRLLIDRIYYLRTAKKTTPTRLIVVVDQSGSMVDAMVQSTILASIFTGLPNVDVHLVAFDTRVLDLTPWVRDPMEVLLRTELGGGTLICQALVEASKKIVEPKNTAMVLISDFYEGGSDQVLLDYIIGLKNSGVHFIPVGALTSSGYFSVSEFFKTRLKELGMPILSGAVTKLIKELRYLLH